MLVHFLSSFFVDRNSVTQGRKHFQKLECLKKSFKNMHAYKKRFYSLTVIVRLSNLNLLCSFFIIKCFFHQVKKKRKKRRPHVEANF